MFRILTNSINKNEYLRKKFLSFFIKFHNFSYRLIKKFLVTPGEIHPKHKIMDYHKFFLDNIESTEIILDIGCGNGALASSVANKGKKIIGIDLNEKNIEQARKRSLEKNSKFIIGDATQYDFSQLNIKTFDKIILSNVLEHIEDRINFLKKLRKLSDVILLRVPMENRDWLTIYKKENGYKYMLDPTHFIEYSIDSLNNELSEADWNLKNYSIQFGELWGVVKK